MDTATQSEKDFSQPVEADFIVSLKAKSGGYDLFVEAFTRKNGKSYLRHTSVIADAKRFSRFTAEDVVEQVKEYRCVGQVERVSPDGKNREVITRK
jgi:hypothetical protein